MSMPQQPMTNTQEASNANGQLQERKGENLKFKHHTKAPQHRLTPPHTGHTHPELGSICNVWPRLPTSCMAVSIHVRWGRPSARHHPGGLQVQGNLVCSVVGEGVESPNPQPRAEL